MKKKLIICLIVFLQLPAMLHPRLELLEEARKVEEARNIPYLGLHFDWIYRSIIIRTKTKIVWKKVTSDKSLLFSLLPRELRSEILYFIMQKKQEEDFLEYRLNNYNGSTLCTYIGIPRLINCQIRHNPYYPPTFIAEEHISPLLFIIKENHPPFYNTNPYVLF